MAFKARSKHNVLGVVICAQVLRPSRQGHAFKTGGLLEVKVSLVQRKKLYAGLNRTTPYLPSECLRRGFVDSRTGKRKEVRRQFRTQENRLQQARGKLVR